MAEEQKKTQGQATSATPGNKPGGGRGPGGPGAGGPGGARGGRGGGGGGRGPGGRGGRNQRGRGRNVTTSPPEFETKTVALDRVSRMQAGGRRFRFRAVVIVGNRKGIIGIGVGKAPDVRSAIEKASRRANENKITVPRVKGTIPREIEVKLGTSRILMRPARPGHGVVAGGVVRTICDLAGITDISAKILSRSSNNLANARATIAGFEHLAIRMAVVRERKAGLKKATMKQESPSNTSG